MTTRQSEVIDQMSRVIRVYESKTGHAVIDRVYSTNPITYARVIIGPRGGVRMVMVYKHYDHQDGEPYYKLYIEPI